MLLILVHLFEKLSMKKTNLILKRKSMTLTKTYLIQVDLFKKMDYNAKITEIGGKIPSITSLATNSVLTAVKYNIPNLSNLVKKTNHDAKIADIENKYITTADYNKFTKDIVAERMKKKNFFKGLILLIQ